MTAGAPAKPRTGSVLVAAVVVAAALGRGWLACVDHSIVYPDEVFQSLEQGHRLAFGYGFVPWEFTYGARSWVFPGLIGLVLRCASTLGADSGIALVSTVKVLMVGLTTLATVLAIALARRLGGGHAAAMCGALFLSFPPLWVYAHRAFSEVAAMPLVCGAALLLCPPADTAEDRTAHAQWHGLLAGCLLSLASVLRFQIVVAGVVFLLGVAAERRWRTLAWAAIGAFAVAMLGGLLDLITWGGLFRSWHVYVEANLRLGLSPTLGTQPAIYYLATTWRAVGPSVLVLVIAAAAAMAVPRARVLAAVGLAFLCVHSAIPHKQWRFILPVLPLLPVLAAVGIEVLASRRRWPAGIRWLIAGGLTVMMAIHARGLTHRDIGSAEHVVSLDAPIWFSGGGLQRLLARAGTRQDVCGLTLVGIRKNWSGGYVYFHRNRPLQFGLDAVRDGSANYVLVKDWERSPLPAAYVRVDTIGDDALFRREGPCRTPDPGYLEF